VIVEGEWGRIEEITLTYVVIRIWDLRRLVVPVDYFLEKPFQNWTRNEAALLGSVELHLDYSVPVEAIRAVFQQVLAESPLWDEKVSGVQVTDSTERTMLVRLLMSASDASRAFDLRCFVRERMITFIQRDHPGALPRTRAELSTGGAGGAPLPA
jgi:small-conductance mechanosensitive channel